MALEYFIQYNTDIGVSFPYINHITYLTNQSFLYLFGFIQARKKTFYSGGRYPLTKKGERRRKKRKLLFRSICFIAGYFRIFRMFPIGKA